MVLVEALRRADSPRLDGENSRHIELLAQTDATPPILVHKTTMRVIDGMHRLRAAQLRHQKTIAVRFFDGDEIEAFVAAVKANRAHGLPLTLADREAAAARILAARPYASDRSIADVTGLAPGTVGVIRRRLNPEGTEVARIGRDGRVRPLSSAEGRRIASEVIAQRPEASLREVAKVAGISPATVQDVRKRMQRGADPTTLRRGGDQDGLQARRERKEGRGDDPGRQPTVRDRALLLDNLKKDPSLRFRDCGRALLRWLGPRAVGPDGWENVIGAIPPHSAYLVAEVARACANDWLEFAAQIERRLGNARRLGPADTAGPLKRASGR